MHIRFSNASSCQVNESVEKKKTDEEEEEIYTAQYCVHIDQFERHKINHITILLYPS